MKVWIQKCVLVFAAVLVSACTRSTPEPVTHTIEMKEYAFSPSIIEVQVGQPVTLEVINSGAIEHEIMFGQDVMVQNDRPNGFEVEMFSAAGVNPETNLDEHTMEGMHEESHTGFMLVLPEKGDRGTISFTPTEDMVGE